MWDKLELKFLLIKVSDNSETRRNDRLFRKMNYNLKKFNLLATLTYTDKAKGYYPIKKRKLEKFLPTFLGIAENRKYYKYSNKKTLNDIFYGSEYPIGSKQNCSLTPYIRTFFDKIQHYYKKNHKTLISYFWKLEIGAKKHRPHIHVVMGIPTKISLKDIWEVFETKWNSGYVDMEIIKNSYQVASYLDKYISKSVNIKSRYIQYGKRQWSCSRDMVNKPVNSDLIYITTLQEEWNHIRLYSGQLWTLAELNYYLKDMAYDEGTKSLLVL